MPIIHRELKANAEIDLEINCNTCGNHLDTCELDEVIYIDPCKTCIERLGKYIYENTTRHTK